MTQESRQQQQQQRPPSSMSHTNNRNNNNDAACCFDSNVKNLVQCYQETSPSQLIGLEQQFLPTIVFDRDSRRFAIYNAIQEIQSAAGHTNNRNNDKNNNNVEEEDDWCWWSSLSSSSSSSYSLDRSPADLDAMTEQIQNVSARISRPSRIFATQLAMAAASSSSCCSET